MIENVSSEMNSKNFRSRKDIVIQADPFKVYLMVQYIFGGQEMLEFLSKTGRKKKKKYKSRPKKTC